jgi:ketosteroid isomerase-like protein
VYPDSVKSAEGEKLMMKKLVGAVVLLLACVAPAFAQTPAPTAKTPSVSATLKQIEHNWVNATKAGDAQKLAQILGDDWIALGYAGAARQTKQGYLAAVKSGGVKLESFEFGPMDVKVLGNVAVVLGSDTEKSTTDGKVSSGKYQWLDVFVKRGGKWVAVRSQNAKVD